MPGILFFADLFASWMDALSEMWEVLQIDMSSLLTNLVENSHPGLPIYGSANLLKGFLAGLGLLDNTLLEFLIMIMGTGFVFYAAISLIKWVVDIIF